MIRPIFRWSRSVMVTESKLTINMAVCVYQAGSTMIHFETYTTGTTRSFRWMKGRPRQARILNPTRLLLDLQERGLPYPAGAGTGTPAPSTSVSPGTGGKAVATREEIQDNTATEYLDENDWYSEEDFMPAEAPPARRWARCTRYTANDAR